MQSAEIDAPALLQDPDRPAPGPRRRLVAAVRGLLVFGAALALVAVALPALSGSSWREIGAVLGRLDAGQLGLLTVLWFLGIYSHSFVLTAALPGLTNRRAMALNMTGSAVSNVLPMGGAAGVGLNYAMVRHWGFAAPRFVLYTVLTNVWDVVAKLCLPALALAALLAAGEVGDHRLVVACVVALGVLVAVLGVLAAVVGSERVAGAVARTVARVLNLLARLARSGRRAEVEHRVIETRRHGLSLVRTAWPQMSAGMAGYLGMQAVLLWACLHVLGSDLSVVQVLAGFAVERLLTLAVITPGGTGLAESLSAAVLVGMGGAPAVTAAAILLYRGFTFALEIPVGGVGIAAWLIALRRRAHRS